jgi:hypothetical protein
LEDLDAEVEINSVWEVIRDNIKISAKESLGYYELKHKAWFDGKKNYVASVCKRTIPTE